MPFRPLHPLPSQHQLTLVFVMSAGEGHHVVFLAPCPSFLPQSTFVLFDLNTYLWLWTREWGAWGVVRRFTSLSSAMGQ